MKIVFLGTNGWYDTGTGNTTCVLIETQENFIILDAGYGFYKAKNYIISDKPVYLFISHLHYDHLIGLHTLPIFNLSQGLDIYIPGIMLKSMREFLRRPFTSPPLLLSTKVRFHAVKGKSAAPFNFEPARMRHSVPCYGYRFNIEDKIITYCTDTGICNNLKKLAQNADVLITECSMAPADRSPNIFHLTPEAAASVAAEINVKKLALMHFDPGKYPTPASRQDAQNAAKAIFKNSIAADDNSVIEI